MNCHRISISWTTFFQLVSFVAAVQKSSIPKYFLPTSSLFQQCKTHAYKDSIFCNKIYSLYFDLICYVCSYSIFLIDSPLDQNDYGSQGIRTSACNSVCHCHLLFLKNPICDSHVPRIFTFMLPCIVIDFLLNNQPDALINQIYSVIKLYMFRASTLPIIRSFLLYIRHW